MHGFEPEPIDDDPQDGSPDDLAAYLAWQEAETAFSAWLKSNRPADERERLEALVDAANEWVAL